MWSNIVRYYINNYRNWGRISDAGSTKDTPYLALTGELWSVFYEYLWENWPCYNGTALCYSHRAAHLPVCSLRKFLHPGCPVREMNTKTLLKGQNRFHSSLLLRFTAVHSNSMGRTKDRIPVLKQLRSMFCTEASSFSSVSQWLLTPNDQSQSLNFQLNCPGLNCPSDHIITYRKVSNIRRTKSQNFNASRLILQLSLPNPLKPGVKLRMKM